jgi:hypothetical protein
MPGVSCPHCHAGLSLAEVTEGWCESCGKQLPPSLQQAAPVLASRARRQEALRKQWSFVGWMMAGVVLGLAGLIGSRLLFDLPPVHEPEKPLLPWLIGVPVGGGIVFSVLFLVLAKRYPKAVRVGVYLVPIVSLVIAGAALLLRLTLSFFK